MRFNPAENMDLENGVFPQTKYRICPIPFPKNFFYF
jgi:hypothetical protein